MKYIGFCAAAGALALAACAGGPPHGRGGPQGGGERGGGMGPQSGGHQSGGTIALPGALFFASLDANGDYAISIDEFMAGLDAAFTAADTNANRQLSPIEYANWASQALGAPDAQPGRIWLDKNLDSSITAEEFSITYRSLAADYGLTATTPITFSRLVRDMAISAPQQSRDGQGSRSGGGPGGGGGGGGGRGGGGGGGGGRGGF